MVTTRQAAPAVHLNHAWRSTYQQRASELISSSSSSSKAFCVCIVGRTGIGKGSLVNHLLQQRVAKVSHESSSIPDRERLFNIHGFRIREIPGYDGVHAVAQGHRRRFHLHSNGSGHSGHRSSGSSHSSGHKSGSSHGSSSDGIGSGSGGALLEIEDFVRTYRLFEEETDAIIFVVNNRITPDDQKLLSLAVESRKFFCIVRTHADGLVQISDSTFQQQRMEETEEELRKELLLGCCLDIRVFILSIPWPESKTTDPELDGSDLKVVLKNTQSLNFPLLQAYLAEPRGLCDELQIHAYVKEKVANVLKPLYNVKKRSQLLDFSQHTVAGTLLPILGPVVVTFLHIIHLTLKNCKELGLIEDSDDAMEKVKIDLQKHSLSSKIASKEALVTAVQDSLVKVFGKVIFEIAFAEIVSTAAQTAFGVVVLPVVGATISALELPHRLEKVADKLKLKACMLHELWIMQNVTGLLHRVRNL